jgi:hypothetical protein
MLSNKANDGKSTYFFLFSTYRKRQFVLVRPEHNRVRITKIFAMTVGGRAYMFQ